MTVKELKELLNSPEFTDDMRVEIECEEDFIGCTDRIEVTIDYESDYDGQTICLLQGLNHNERWQNES